MEETDGNGDGEGESEESGEGLMDESNVNVQSCAKIIQPI